MTKDRHAILQRMRKARQVLDESDPTEVRLIKTLYDMQLRKFARINPDRWTTEEYNTHWENETETVKEFVLKQGYLRSDTVFYALWDACDVLSLEAAQAYA